jgi:serine/threonine protein kinase
LGDFGESRFVKEGEMLQGRYGALWFMAPEIFNNQQYTSKCDLYSLGIVLYFLFNGGLPPFMEKYSDGCANNPELNPILIRRMKGEIILPPKYAAEKEWAIIKYMLYNYNESESLSNSLLMLNSLLSLEDYPLQIIDNNVVPIHNVSCFSTEFGNNNFAKTDFLFNTCGNSVEQDCCICSKVEMTGAYSITDSDMEEVAPSISENESMMK